MIRNLLLTGLLGLLVLVDWFHRKLKVSLFKSLNQIDKNLDEQRDYLEQQLELDTNDLDS